MEARVTAPTATRPGVLAELPPMPPPVGASARRDTLVRHFVQHQDRHTRHALDQRARAARYSDNDVAAAWTVIDIEDGGKVPAARFATIAKAVIVALYLATFAVFAGGSSLATGTGHAMGVAALGVVLVIVGGVALRVVSLSKVVPANPLAALATLLALPLVFLVIVAGLCVITAGSTFFPAAAS
jgi:hypothetical protein